MSSTRRPHRTRPAARALSVVTVVLLSALLALAPAALASGGSAWPTSLGVAGTSHQPAAAGPTNPGLAWIMGAEDLDGFEVDGATAGTAGDLADLVLSSTGDLLATARRTVLDDDGEPVREGAVLSLAPDTGALRWARTDLDDVCSPAVAADGSIWVLQDLNVPDTRQDGDHPDATRALVALDPQDGSLLADRRYTGEDVALRPAARPCGESGLQLGADGSVLLLDDTSFNPTVRAVDPDGQARWELVLPRSCSPARWLITDPVHAAGGDRAYLLTSARDDDEDCPHPGRSVVALDLATGEVVDELEVPGERFASRTASLVLPGGDLVLATDGPRGSDPAHLLRLSPSGGLSVVWQQDIDDSLRVQDPACAQILCGRVRGMATDGQQLVVQEGNRLAALNLDGTLRWRDATGMTGPIVLDAEGRAYVGRSSGTGGPRVAVISPDGQELATVLGIDGLGTPRALGPIDLEGTLYGRDAGGQWFALVDDAAPLAACLGVAVPEAGFTDVNRGNTHARNIDCVVFYDLAQGTSATTFAPSQPVSRQQMATFIARLIDASDRALPAAGPQFTDVDGVHADNINRLAAAGVVLGTTPGRFDPQLPVRRDQMASFLVRAFEYIVEREVAPAEVAFRDIAGTTHELNIRKVAQLGFTQGLTPTTYDPFSPVRRDQMASFLARALETLVVDEGRIEPRG